MKPSLNTVGAPLGSTPPTIPLIPSMWSNERFSRARTKTCSIFFCLVRVLPNSDFTPSMVALTRQRSQSHALQTRCSAQPNARHVHRTTQANALHTSLTTQYQALHTRFATQ